MREEQATQIAARLKDLRPEQRALLEMRVRATTQAQREPLSSMQFAMWLFDELHSEGAAYNNPAAIRLSGTLDVEALRTVVRLLHDRHELLRGRIDDSGDEPTMICDVPPIDIEVLATPLDVDDLLASESTRRFDTAHGPLWRVVLLPIDDTEHVLLIVLHHMVSDGWSLGVLLEELAAAYGAIVDGDPISLPVAPSKVMALARSTDTPSEPVRARCAEYWRHTLSSSTMHTPLPFDRDVGESAEAGGVVAWLSDEQTRDLEASARGSGTTLTGALLTAFACLVRSETGADDIIVTTPVARRNSASARAVGCFLNTVPVRVQLERGRAAQDLLAHVGQSLRRAVAHSELPFAEILRLAPTAQVPNLMVVENNAPGLGTVGPLTAERYEIPVPGVKNDWTLMHARTPLGTRLEIEFRRHAFTKESMQRRLDTLVELTRRIASDPRSPLDSELKHV